MKDAMLEACMVRMEQQCSVIVCRSRLLSNGIVCLLNEYGDGDGDGQAPNSTMLCVLISMIHDEDFVCSINCLLVPGTRLNQIEE